MTYQNPFKAYTPSSSRVPSQTPSSVRTTFGTQPMTAAMCSTLSHTATQSSGQHTARALAPLGAAPALSAPTSVLKSVAQSLAETKAALAKIKTELNEQCEMIDQLKTDNENVRGALAQCNGEVNEEIRDLRIMLEDIYRHMDAAENQKMVHQQAMSEINVGKTRNNPLYVSSHAYMRDQAYCLF